MGSIKKSLVIIGLGLMASCGSQSPEGQGVENTTKTLDNSSEISFAQAQLVETSDAMEACTQDKHRALIYLLEKSQFYYCSSTLEWVAIDLKGPKGDKGEKGDTGATGSSGKSGSNGQATLSLLTNGKIR